MKKIDCGLGLFSMMRDGVGIRSRHYQIDDEETGASRRGGVVGATRAKLGNRALDKRVRGEESAADVEDMFIDIFKHRTSYLEGMNDCYCAESRSGVPRRSYGLRVYSMRWRVGRRHWRGSLSDLGGRWTGVCERTSVSCAQVVGELWTLLGLWIYRGCYIVEEAEGALSEVVNIQPNKIVCLTLFPPAPTTSYPAGESFGWTSTPKGFEATYLALDFLPP
ncbi:hypothetical protein Tco_1134492 [Tanacetum coccineum]|uniref:Uncharacterized protein n=1 Tax=Tanacetum coccineum TaxID=301880 RepID=A0ABQ5GVY8_9ASTR